MARFFLDPGTHGEDSLCVGRAKLPKTGEANCNHGRVLSSVEQLRGVVQESRRTLLAEATDYQVANKAVAVSREPRVHHEISRCLPSEECCRCLTSCWFLFSLVCEMDDLCEC